MKPTCGHCKKRYTAPNSCVYNAKDSKEKRPSTQPSTVSIYSRRPPVMRIPSPILQYPTGLSEKDRLLELRLLHHFTITTCRNQTPLMVVPVFCYPMWQFDIPQMAFSSDVVLNGLLSISALHLLYKSPEDQDLMRASSSYLDKAVKKHRLAVANVDPESIEPLLVSAVLVSHFVCLQRFPHFRTPSYILLNPLQISNIYSIRSLVIPG